MWARLWQIALVQIIRIVFLKVGKWEVKHDSLGSRTQYKAAMKLLNLCAWTRISCLRRTKRENYSVWFWHRACQVFFRGYVFGYRDRDSSKEVTNALMCKLFPYLTPFLTSFHKKLCSCICKCLWIQKKIITKRTFWWIIPSNKGKQTCLLPLLSMEIQRWVFGHGGTWRSAAMDRTSFACSPSWQKEREWSRLHSSLFF